MTTSTTTIDSIRDSFEASVAALTPSSASGVGFEAGWSEKPLREWAESNPASCFRRFEIMRTGTQEPGEVELLGVGEKLASLELVVAYPRELLGQYGVGNLRDMQALIQADADLIIDTIGGAGYANWPAGLLDCQETDSIEDGGAVSFLVIDMQIRFYRAAAA